MGCMGSKLVLRIPVLDAMSVLYACTLVSVGASLPCSVELCFGRCLRFLLSFLPFSVACYARRHEMWPKHLSFSVLIKVGAC